MKYLITGFPGTGKSTVSDELENRGYKSYDTDNLPGFHYFIDRETKQRIDKPSNAPSNWNLNHDWVWNPDKIEKALNQDGDVFICAITPSQIPYYSKFNKIFILTLDEQTLRQRLKTRTTNYFGKNPEELNHVLENYEKFRDSLAKNHNAIIIDASQPLLRVVDKILSHVDED
jgi:broad-specificity NMP kinase